MKTKFIFYGFFFLLFGCHTKPSVEKTPTIQLDFEAAKAYFPLVEKIKSGDTISRKEWADFFSIEGNRLFVEDLKYTDEKVESLIETIEATYQPGKEHLVYQKKSKENRSSYRNRYKKNHQLYQDYLTQIERMQVTFVDSMINRTKAFLPKDLVVYRAMPTIYYHALSNNAKATVNNRIFVSVLASYERDIHRIANLEAHELHHNFRPDLSYYKARSDSSYYKTEIEEVDIVVYNALMLALNEGLADMIDTDFLLADTSKWWRKDSVQAQMSGGKNVVKKLNEYLAAAANGAIQNWELYDTLLGYDGHIPGYFMAKTIKDNGQLGEIIEHAGNPFVFFLTYQEVALIDKKSPVFDDVVIDYLKQLKTKYSKKLEVKYQDE